MKVLPAAKANWVSAVQHILADEGCGCDVYSSGELIVALNAGINPQFISVNGVPKDEEHNYRCVREGVRITVGSLEEVDFIEQAAIELGRVAKVRLRLKPALSGFTNHSDFVAEGLVSTDIAAMVYKGGLTFEQIMAVAPRILNMKNVELVGFRQHHGRHDPSTRYWEEQLDAASKALKALEADAHYRALAKLIDGIVTRPNQTPAPSIEEYAGACTHTLSQGLPRHGINIQDLMLQLEPGRSLHGNTGIHLRQ